MKFLASIICILLALVALTVTGNAARQTAGLERQIIELSGGVISGVLFLLFIILTVIDQVSRVERCGECGRPADPRLAYGEDGNTKNPPCRECHRPLPDSRDNG